MGGYVKCFGTGPGKSNGERSYSSYYYRFGETGIMVDCGEPLSLSFKKAKGDVDGFDALLISHTHADHVGGFLSFMQSLKHGERERPLDIHLPGHAIPVLKGLMEAAYIFPEGLPFSFEFQKLEAGRDFRVSGVRVTPYATSHLEATREKFQKRHPIAFESFSFLFESDDGAVVHSGDLGSEKDLVPLLERPLDLLVAELAHAEPEEMFKLVSKSPVSRAGFVHLKDSQWKTRAQLKRQATSIMKKQKVEFPEDGDKLRF